MNDPYEMKARNLLAEAVGFCTVPSWARDRDFDCECRYCTALRDGTLEIITDMVVCEEIPPAKESYPEYIAAHQQRIREGHELLKRLREGRE